MEEIPSCRLSRLIIRECGSSASKRAKRPIISSACLHLPFKWLGIFGVKPKLPLTNPFLQICTNSDDGSRVLVDGTEAAAAPGLHPPEKKCGDPLRLEAGYHPVVVDFFENGRGATIVVSYSGPDTEDKEYLMPSVWHDTEQCGPAPEA